MKERTIVVALALAVFGASAVLGGSAVRLLGPSDAALAAALRGSAPRPVPALTAPLATDDVRRVIAGLKITAPDLDFGLSPLPSLPLSAFNLAAPDLPATGLFTNMGIDPKVDFRGDLTVPAPPTRAPDFSTAGGSDPPPSAE